MKRKEILLEIIVFLFVLLFLYAAGSKLMEYDRFSGQLAMSYLLTNFSGWIAWMIPAIEIIIAMLLLIPRFRVTGFYMAFGLMLVFSWYIIAILTWMEELPCACGGILALLGWKEHLIFNIGFVLLGLTGIILTSEKEATNKSISAL